MIYDRLIYETEDSQVRATINIFNGIEYFHLRKYYMGFEGDWVPGKEGVAMPLDLSNVKELFIALLEILSLGESKQAIQEHFKELLEDIYV